MRPKHAKVSRRKNAVWKKQKKVKNVNKPGLASCCTHRLISGLLHWWPAGRFRGSSSLGTAVMAALFLGYLAEQKDIDSIIS